MVKLTKLLDAMEKGEVGDSIESKKKWLDEEKAKEEQAQQQSPEPLITTNPIEFAFEKGIRNEETIALAKIKLGECYEEIIEILRTYMDLKPEQYKFIAWWIIGTYYHQSFQAYPFLFFNAMRGSGKTRMLKLISNLAKGGDGSVLNNLTEAVLFRIPKGTTTCIDEMESIGSKEKQTLRELLNAAYKKGMKVKRMRKMKINGVETQVTESFEPYFPIAMANIWGMDEVLADRSITLILEKSDNQVVTKLMEDFHTLSFSNLKRTLEKISVVSDDDVAKKYYIGAWNNYISTKNNYTNYTNNINYTNYTNYTKLHMEDNKSSVNVVKNLELEEIFEKIDCLNIAGRNLELMFPILIIANFLSKDEFEEALKICKEIIEEKKQDEYNESKDVQLYSFIFSLRDEKRFFSLKDLTSQFRFYSGESENEHQWLNEKWLGRALKRLNLILDKKRMHDGVYVTLNYNKATEKLKIFKREESKKDDGKV